MKTDREILDEINRKLGKQPYISLAFFLLGLSIATWGWGMNQNSLDWWYIGFGIWIFSFILIIIGILKK